MKRGHRVTALGAFLSVAACAPRGARPPEPAVTEVTPAPGHCPADTRARLETMAAEDDAVIRRGLNERDAGTFDEAEHLREFEALARTHARQLSVLLDACGWPMASVVGRRATEAAFLVCQHADHDLPFQKRCLALMRDAVAAGEASGADAAYLVDRVRVNEGRPQYYGTQLREREDGELELFPVEDLSAVDERRRKAGLCRLELYLRADSDACAADVKSAAAAMN